MSGLPPGVELPSSGGGLPQGLELPGPSPSAGVQQQGVPATGSALAPLPQLRTDINERMDQLSRQYGIPGWALHTMAQMESGGEKDPIHAKSSSGALGVMQFTPDTWHDYGQGKDVFDMKANTDAGARYYKALLDRFGGNPVLAAGAYNAGPGVIEAWQKGKAELTPETVKYMARVQAASIGHDEVPLPPKPVTPQSAERKNDDPRKAKYNVLEQIGGHQDLPFILINAAAMDKANGTGSKYVQDAWDLWHKNPGAAGAVYGLGSKNSLQAYKTSSVPEVRALAEAMEKNSFLDGGLTFVGELVNPMAWLEGGVAGKILKGAGMGAVMAAKATGQEDKLAYLQHLFSPWKDVIAGHEGAGYTVDKTGYQGIKGGTATKGTDVRNALAKVGQQFAVRDRQAEEHMTRIFGGLDEDEQVELLRRQQLRPAVAPKSWANLSPDEIKKRSAVLDARAKDLQDTIREHTAEAYKWGALTHGQIFGVKGSAPTTLSARAVAGKKMGSPLGQFDFDPGTYFPMKGSYLHPFGTEFNNVLKDLGYKDVGGSIKSRTYDNIDTQMADPNFNHGEFDPAQHLYRYLSAIGKRVEFEQSLRDLEKLGVIKLGMDDKLASAYIKNGAGKWVSTKKDVLGDLPDTASPAFKNSIMSPALAKFFKEAHNMSIMTGQSMVARGAATSKTMQFVNGYNQMMRAAIIYNPMYHPFWNIATNHSAAEARGITALPHMLNDYTRAVIGTGASVLDGLGIKWGAKTLDAVREGLEGHWHNGASTYHDALLAAEKAGATAEFGASKTALGGNIGRINTVKADDLSIIENLDKQLTRALNWNKEATFGKRGEGAFSATLFQRLKKDFGMNDDAAAWATREALGNYRNVDPESWQSKLLFFYPWLKSNVPFWFKTFLKHPQFANAPVEGSRRQREMAGDPDIYSAGYPQHGVGFYLGKDSKTGGDTRLNIPLPLKDAATFAQSVGGIATEPLQNSITNAASEISNRMNPLAGGVRDVVGTAINPRATQPGSFQGLYTTAFNKDLPPLQQLGQVVQSMGIQLAPVPVPFLAHDLARQAQSGRGIALDSSHVAQYATEALGLGQITVKESDAVKHASRTLDNALERQMAGLRKRQNGANPLNPDEAAALANKYAQEYSDKQAMLYDRIAKKAKPGVPLGIELPPGVELATPPSGVALP